MTLRRFAIAATVFVCFSATAPALFQLELGNFNLSKVTGLTMLLPASVGLPVPGA